MLPRILISTLCAGLLMAVVLSPVRAAEPQTDAADAAAAYIITLQQPDGGFLGFEGSSPGTTLDAMFALIAQGIGPTPVYNKGASPLDYLASTAAEYAADPGGAAKLALGVALAERAGVDGDLLSDFGGVDLRAAMDENVDPSTGAYGLDVFDEAFYILAQIAAGKDAPAMTAQHLRSLQLADGGWEFGPGFESDTNTTALVLQAIIAAGTLPDDGVVDRGLAYLLAAQHEGGGWGFIPGEDADPHSTAFVIQALIAAHEDIDAGGIWAQRGATPIAALLSFQNRTTGAFRFFGEDSPFSTYQSVPGLMLAPFPYLETMDDSEQPIDTPTAQPTGRELQPTSTPQPVLPDAGSGRGGGNSPSWIILTMLASGGALAAGVGLAVRRPR